METKVNSQTIRKKLKELGYSITYAAEVLGMTRQNLNKHLSNDELSENFIRLFKEKIGLENYVSTVGEPLHEYGKKTGTPLVPIDAIAGKHPGELVIRESDIESRYFIPEFAKADFLIRVKGSSMYPKYSSGDILACVKVSKSDFIQWNKTYVIDTNQGVLVKRILKGKDAKHWILRSDNKDFQDIDINADKDVHHINLVIGVIRLE